MTNREYNLWTLTELRQDDPREYLDVIIQNAKFDRLCSEGLELPLI